MSEELKPCPFCGVVERQQHMPDCWFTLHAIEASRGKLIAAWNRRAALASTRTASEQEIVTAGDRMARWLYGLSQSEAMPESWRTTCAELAQAWKGTASDTRTASGEAECDAALGRAAPAGQHDAFPAVLFDGKAVYDEITARLGKGHCFSADAVSATLDAVVRLIRRTASTDAAAGAAAGGNTYRGPGHLSASKAAETRMDTGFEGGHLVDVEAERKLFEAWAVGPEGEWMPHALARGHKNEYRELEVRVQWTGWLAARTQADAGKAPTTTKPENT